MRFTPPRSVALTMAAASLALSACATISPEQKVRASLVDAGLSPRMATCMADRMVDRLSLDQLRRLKSLASLERADMGAMSVDRLLYKVRAIDDPEIFIVTSRAALACAL
ncbi:hypothetical protein [Sphingobium aromaticiconvertens]|uniref:hypothetical protein n=1 Tax=Sphingobium aromaticiconvertens TaxID=365341 RepID=UPI00301B39FE